MQNPHPGLNGMEMQEGKLARAAYADYCSLGTKPSWCHCAWLCSKREPQELLLPPLLNSRGRGSLAQPRCAGGGCANGAVPSSDESHPGAPCVGSDGLEVQLAGLALHPLIG